MSVYKGVPELRQTTAPLLNRLFLMPSCLPQGPPERFSVYVH